MTAVASRSAALQSDLARLAETLVAWLETGERPVDLFSGDLFVDVSLPQWRLQGEGGDAAFLVREQSHPHPGTVIVGHLDATPRGFLIEFEERWDAEGQPWYCREMIHCIVTAGRISELRVYCTGDWDEMVQASHAQQVRLIRP